LVRVRLGIHLPNGGFGRLSFSYVRDLGIKAEKLEYDSLWVADHAIYPESLGPQNIYEPLTTLAALSSVTKRVSLGTSILLPLRNPLHLANMLATLDNASNGRVVLGMGVGWYKPEFDASSVPFSSRGEIQEEEIELLKMLWSKPSVNFNGKHFQMSNVVTGPKPIQKPYPKIWLGGGVERTFQRVAKHANGWLAWCPALDTFSAGVKRIRSIANSEGLNASRLDFAADFMACIKTQAPSARAEAKKLNTRGENWIVGNAEVCAETLARYVKEGATHIVLGFVPYGKELASMRIAAEAIQSI
jgi:probable F420-dependent oxidoreductase